MPEPARPQKFAKTQHQLLTEILEQLKALQSQSFLDRIKNRAVKKRRAKNIAPSPNGDTK